VFVNILVLKKKKREKEKEKENALSNEVITYKGFVC
jgi:hypothetical protein